MVKIVSIMAFIPYITDQDKEDYEQEKLIQEWLGENGKQYFKYANTTSTGNIKHSTGYYAISLDQPIRNSGGDSTYHEITTGSLFDNDSDESEFEPRDASQIIKSNLEYLLLNLKVKGNIKWIINQWILSRQSNNKLIL